MHRMRVGAIAERQERTPDAKAETRRPARLYLFAKRAVDILGSIIALIIFGPLMLFVAAAVYIDSPGPIFFRQKRIGREGVEFRFFKFRSMRPDAEALLASLKHLNEAKGPIFKIQDDPRITRVGRVIRKYSLDELPQLFNVLRGEISLVGPRPHLPCEVKEYKPWHAQRLTVQPGVVCLREVSGRSKLSFDEWVALDLEYIQKRTLWLDIKILFRVIPAILFHDGAC